MSPRRCLASVILAATLAAGAPASAQGTVGVATVTEADGTATLLHELVVAAPIADVWAAISTPAGWMDWAVPLARWAGDEPDVLETSYDPSAAPGGASTIRQRFLARIPGRLLAFRTIKAPEGFPNWEEYRQVVSIFELETAGSGTRVRLTSTGYPATDGGRALVAYFEIGNAQTLEAL